MTTIETTSSAASAIDEAASSDALREITRGLSASGDSLEALRDALHEPRLAEGVHELATSTRWLAVTVTALANGLLVKEPELVRERSVVFLALRSREIARRKTLAECRGDGSRDQSDAWARSAHAAMGRLLHSEGVACRNRAAARSPRFPFSAALRVYVGGTGRVELAGLPLEEPLPKIFETFEAETLACVVRALEGEHFPPPADGTRAILLAPMVSES